MERAGLLRRLGRRSAKRCAALLTALALLVVAGCGGGQGAGAYFTMGSVPRGCVSPALRLFGRDGGRPAPVVRATLPSAAVLARFELFRRRAQPGDLPSVAARTLAGALGSAYELTSVDAAYARRVTGSAATYAIPVAGRPDYVVPKRCPAALRDTSGARKRYTGGPAYCTFAVRRRRRVTDVRCAPFAAADSGAAPFSGLRGRREVVLVPDGVARVRISYLKRPSTIAPAHGDAVAVTLVDAPGRVEFLDRAGRVVHAIDVFSAARGAQLTRTPIHG